MTEDTRLFPELVSPEQLLTWIFGVLLSCVSTNIGRFAFPFFSWAISGRKNKANQMVSYTALTLEISQAF